MAVERVRFAAALLALAACCLPAAAAATAAAGRRLVNWTPQWPWTPGVPGSEDLRSEWERTLAELWRRSKDSVGFCVGRSQCVRCSHGLGLAVRLRLLAPLICILNTAPRRPPLPPGTRRSGSWRCPSPGHCRWAPTPATRCAATARASMRGCARRPRWSSTTRCLLFCAGRNEEGIHGYRSCRGSNCGAATPAPLPALLPPLRSLCC